MCGIVGQSLFGGLATESQALRRAQALLRHRGPDDSGVFEDPGHGVYMAHTRLAIVDLTDSGRQPFVSRCGRVVLVFNGEIYNFRELRTELESRGIRFRGESDTEVLLELYLSQREGAGNVRGMLRRLNGIFAFALWDADRGELLVARDALGVKPLYFSATSHGVLFASELKALQPLRHPVEDAAKLDAVAVDQYMSFLWCPSERSPDASVKKLGPGEAMWVRRGAISDRFVWYRLPIFRQAPLLPGFNGQSPSAPSSDFAEAAAIQGTETLLRAAVHRQMVADVPVGAFLSGGLDSSSVVAFARELNPDLSCFTIEVSGAQEDGVADDLPYARAVASHLNVPLEVVRIDARRMADDLPSMIEQLDEPLADPAPLNVLYISRLAREHGMKVLLSGSGGDDLFAGYRRHQALAAERYWGWIPASAWSALERLAVGFGLTNVFARRMQKIARGAHLSGDDRLVSYFLWVDRKDLDPLYTPAFRSALGSARAEEPMLRFLAEIPAGIQPVDRLLALEQRFFLADHNLMYTDKMSMAAGVEVRVPFLDLDLVEFAASVPGHLKLRGPNGKWVLRKAMERYLPREVINRPKTGFGAPLRRWIRFELRELVMDLLSEQSLKNRGIFEPVAAKRLVDSNERGRIDASYTILGMMCLELWCRRFLDRPVPPTWPNPR
jgi:asparagine synthase (glutamine-hydrolysing)